MGTYMRKCEGIGEIVVMELADVGVRTRARALAMDSAARSRSAKRRKVGGGRGGGEGELKFSSTTSLVELRSRRRAPENSVSEATSGTVSNDQCLSSTSSSHHVPASCCSSNASSDLSNESLKISDLEDESSVQIEKSPCDFDCKERREITETSEVEAESGDLESTARPSEEANSRRRSSAEKMPSETELEEFFSTAEKDLHKRFSEKYNYDIAKDVPLEGRYEWVRLKP